MQAGDVIARIPTESAKTRDITGGLPRVAELFEARRPKEAAIIADTSGTVRFGKDYKNKRRITIEPSEKGLEPVEYLIPKGKHIHLQDGDVIEKGVADAVTFPWGSIPLFGIDKVTKFHMDVPLYATSFAWVINKSRFDAMSVAQKKVIDDHCTTQWAIRAASPWADFEHAGIKKLKDEGHDVYPLTDAQLAEWKKSAEPVVQTWAEAVKKAGGDPDAVLKDFKAVLAKYKSAY